MNEAWAIKPWRQDDILRYMILDANGKHVLTMRSPEEAVGVVLAVNSHDDLMDALKRISNGNDVGHMVEWANDALTKLNP